MNRILWYEAPAREWTQALPVGNGRIGGMVFGGVECERIQLNEDSLWYGGPRFRLNPDARANVGKVRQLLFDGRIREAERLATLALVGVPENPAHYVPVGDLLIEMSGRGGQSVGYRRVLDITEAECRTSYTLEGVAYERVAIASAPDQVLAVRLSCGRPGGISCTVRFTRERYAGLLSHPDERTILMQSSGGGEGSVGFAALARAVAGGGSLSTLGEHIVVEGADSLVVLVTVATTYRAADPLVPCFTEMESASRRPWADLVSRHRADYHALFDRMDLDLGASGDTALPTDTRLKRVVEGGHDTGLVELYFHFGRYLMVSGSRPGTLPMTLQGIWNDSFLPPWGSKYTININTEMNYWPAEKANLGECALPLLDLLERMLPNGRRVARDMYGCRGFVAHHNTDLWGDCAPVDLCISAAIWPMGAAWLCLHLWEHWQYTGDRAFLDRAYPVMREAALFHLDFLCESPDGRLVTNPSVSPENTYILPSGEQGSMCFGPSMDSQILHALFSACHEAAGVLGTDADLAGRFVAARDRLPAPAVGRHGQLMEWPHDYDEAEPGHRHISHLFALHPGDQITVTDTPELARAARITLERRLKRGGGHTGWSKAWIINMWARLREGNLAWENTEGILRQSTFSNLFDSHPPFQIDGNFGAAAGIMEMLVQCLRGVIHVLPALPSALPHGSARGMRAKGGFELSLRWERGALAEMSLRSDLGNLCRLAYGRRLEASDEGGAEVEGFKRRDDGVVEFPTRPGASYRIRVVG